MENQTILNERERFPFVKEDILELILLVLISLAPFSLQINAFIFKNYEIVGLSAFNALVLLAFCLKVAVIITASFAKTGIGSRVQGFSILAAFGVFVLVVVCKMLLANDLSQALGWLSQYQYFLWVPIVLFVFLNLRISSNYFVKLSLGISWVVCAISLYSFFSSNYFGLVTQATLDNYAIVSIPFYRMMGTFGSPNVAGAYYAIILVMLLYLGNIQNRVLKVLHVIVLGSCLILSFSRMALIGLVCCLFFYLLFRTDNSEQRNKHNSRGFLAAFGLLVAAIMVILILRESGFYFWEGFDIVNNPRIEKWTSFLMSFDQWILIGAPLFEHISMGSLTLSDNSFLLLLGAVGLFAAALYIFFIGKPLLNLAKSNPKLKTVYIMLIVFLVLSDFVSLYPCNYYAALLIWALGYNKENEYEATHNYTPMSLSSGKKWRNSYPVQSLKEQSSTRD